MLDADRWQEVFQSLRRNKLRTALTACGVFWGVFMLVVMLGFGRGLEGAITGELGNWAQNTVFVWGERTSKPFAGRQLGRTVVLREDDASELVARVPGIAFISPRNSLGGYGARGNVSRKGKSESFAVTGETPAYRRMERLIIEDGRFLSPLDLKDLRKVAVIGARVRESLFERGEEPIGQTIRIGNVQFTVVGVFRSPASGRGADWANGRVFVPRSTFKRTFGTGNRVDYFAMLVDDERSSSAVEEEARAILKRRHGVHPDDPRAIASYNQEKNFRKVKGVFLGIEILTWVVGLLTLLAGAIGVGNIMMIAVAERTKEIAVRKALGATPWSVLSQILEEALVLTGLAGYAGLCTGVGVLAIASAIVERLPKTAGPSFFTSPDIDLSRALIAVAVLTAAGVLAGLAPARSALAIRPAVALAHE